MGIGRVKRILLLLERASYRIIVVPLIAFLPAPLAYGIACQRSALRYLLDTPKRKEIMHCLERVLGNQLTTEARTRTTKDIFRLRSCLPVDQTRIAGKGEALAKLVEMRGLEHIEAALAGGKGAIICVSHFGGFNCGLSLLGARGFPITLVGRWASNNVEHRQSSLSRLFYRLTVQKSLARHRRRTNIEPLGQVGVAVQAARVLQQNELIVIGIDAPALDADRQRAVPMDFLNGQAQLIPGAATIAQLIGAPVLMMFIRRSPDWHHQVLEITPPISMDGDVVTAFKRCLAVAESAIRQTPSHWAYWNVRDLTTLGLLPEETVQDSQQQEKKNLTANIS